MNGENPDAFTPEDMNLLVRSLAKVGWLEGNQLVDQKQMHIRYSDMVLKKMRKLVQIFKPYYPGSFGDFRRPPVPLDSVFQGKVGLAAPEVIMECRQGFLPIGALNALGALVIMFYQDLGE